MASEWKFDHSVVPIFDEHVRQNVPMYDEIHRLIIDIGAWFLEDNSRVYDIGTSTGEVIYNFLQTYPHKQCAYVGFDISLEMVQKAQQRLKEYENVTILHKDVCTSDIKFENASFITSVLTLQFLPIRDRLALLRKIHNGLNQGGGLVLVEKVTGQNARFNEMWVELYNELKLRNGMSEEAVFNKMQAIRGVLKPLTLDENLALLQEAGFDQCDVFFKWTNFVGIISRKS